MKARRRLLIQPGFQTWFLLRFLAYTGMLMLVLGAGIYVWVRIVANTIFHLVGLISDSSVKLIKMNSDMGLVVFLILTGVLVSLAVFESFIFSRRIAGPLFAITRHLKKCEQRGRLEKFHLRKGDLLVEVTDQFNRLVDSINSKNQKKSLSDSIGLKSFGGKRLKRA